MNCTNAEGKKLYIYIQYGKKRVLLRRAEKAEAENKTLKAENEGLSISVKHLTQQRDDLRAERDMINSKKVWP